MITVTEALDSDTAETVTVKRTGVGSYVDGIYVKGSETTFTTLCSVQQPTPDQILVLPEGERNKDLRLFISAKLIRGTSDKDGIIADKVYYKGNWYKIISPGDWVVYGYSNSIGARD